MHCYRIYCGNTIPDNTYDENIEIFKNRALIKKRLANIIVISILVYSVIYISSLFGFMNPIIEIAVDTLFVILLSITGLQYYKNRYITPTSTQIFISEEFVEDIRNDIDVRTKFYNGPYSKVDGKDLYSLLLCQNCQTQFTDSGMKSLLCDGETICDECKYTSKIQ